MNLYQASIKRKRKRFEIHYAKNAYKEVNIEVNNALIEDISTIPINDIHSAPIKEKSLEVSDLFEDPNEAKSPNWWKGIQT